MSKKSRNKFLKRFQNNLDNQKLIQMDLKKHYDEALKQNHYTRYTTLNDQEFNLFYQKQNIQTHNVVEQTNNIKEKYIKCGYDQLWFDTMFKFRLLRFFSMEDFQEFTNIENVKKFENDFRNLQNFDDDKKLKLLSEFFIFQSLAENPQVEPKLIKKVLKINLKTISKNLNDKQQIADIFLQTIHTLNLCLELKFSPLLVQMLLCQNLVSCNVTPIVAFNFSDDFINKSLTNQRYRIFNKKENILDLTSQISQMFESLSIFTNYYLKHENISKEAANQFNYVLKQIKPKNELKLKIISLLFIYYAKQFKIQEIEAYLNTQLRFIQPHIDSLLELGLINCIESRYSFNQKFLINANF